MVVGEYLTRTFIQTTEFSRKWDELGFDDDDLWLMEQDILKDPKKYPVMIGTGKLRKVEGKVEVPGCAMLILL